MAEIIKPIYTQDTIWSKEGSKALPPESKIKGGWHQEMMPAEYENWIQNRQDQALAYFYQFGLAEWDSLTEYIGGRSLVQSDGRIYRAIQNSLNLAPLGNPTHWRDIFVGLDYVTAGPLGSSAHMPSGTTAQRPTTTAPAGTTHLRYNSTTKRWEYQADSTWFELIDKSHGSTGTGVVVFATNPVLEGAPKAPTQPVSDNSKNIATTEFVKAALAQQQTAGASVIKPTTASYSASPTTVQDIALPVLASGKAYLLLSLETAGAEGDVWDIEIYDSAAAADKLLYFARLIQGKFTDKIPMTLETTAPIMRVVNQRADSRAVAVTIKVTTLPCA